jgi:predicted MFS family arabinose efflux permease
VTPIEARLLAARGLRGFADGVLAITLPLHLVQIGFGPGAIGAFVAATLLGSAALTLAVGLLARRASARSVLLGACALMLATALGLAVAGSLVPLLLIGFIGTFNPSGGDVGVFLPTEQALLAEQAAGPGLAALFARYNLGGALGAALGALAAPLLAPAAFAAYGAAALLLAVLYLPLGGGRVRASVPLRPPLARSRRTVLGLSALFSLDSFGGGFAVQSLLVLWLHARFGLSVEATGAVFFASGLLGAVSQLAAGRLSGRLGLVRTMVFTHVPANLFLLSAALAPSAPLAIAFLLLRASLSQMDVPARQALVMRLVPAEERAAAASVTNVPRSLAAALAPLPAGAMLAASSFGWPLIAGGLLKIAYDLWLFAAFRGREPGRGVG